MNKIANTLLIALLATVLIGCSSGSSTTASQDALNITGKFEGTFENTEATQDGAATFDIVLAEDGLTVSGNALFDREGGNTCLLSGPFEGTLSGTRLSLTLDDFTFELSVSSDANSISGTYARSTDANEDCGRTTGSGSISLTRS